VLLDGPLAAERADDDLYLRGGLRPVPPAVLAGLCVRSRLVVL